MTTDDIRIRDLKFVVALYETGNMTQAAKRLGVSEPAVSQRLRKVEFRTQERLFDRDNGSIKVTEAGRLFVARAKESIHAFQMAVHEAHEARHGKLHRLRIGLSVFLPQRWLQLVQSIELPLYRNLNIEVATAYSMSLLGMLESHELDLVVVNSPPDSALTTTRCVAASSFMIVLRVTHPLAAKKSLTLPDVAQHPWIFFHREVHPPLHDLILDLVAAGGARARILHRVSRTDQVPPLLVDSAMLAWPTPGGAEIAAHEDLVCIPLVDSRIRLETHLVARANEKSPLVSEYFRTFVKRIEEDQAPVQIPLPIGFGPHRIATRSESTSEVRELRRRRA